MGLADLPRAYFSGFVYWNPSTMNNNDNQPTYDPATATLNWPWLERHGLADDEAFDKYVTQPAIVPSANDVMLGQFFDATAPPAEWNFYGDNSCGFVQQDEPKLEWPQKFTKPKSKTVITGYTNDAGTFVSSDDPWIGLPIHLNPGKDSAKLVDVDPVAAWSSQIFLDTFGVGSRAAGNGLLGATPGRAHSRWVFFHRNYNDTKDVIIAGVASAMWQIALPKESLAFFNTSPAAGSLAAQLDAALSGPRVRGLMVRFVTYHTVYFQGSQFKVRDKPDWKAISDLYQEYAAALEQYERGTRAEPPPKPVNRAYSNVVGWIAPWTSADMRTMAVGRILHASGNTQPILPIKKPAPVGPAALEFVADALDPTRVGRVSIDLGSTIPERGSTLDKVDFGTMLLGLETVGGAPNPFAAIAYPDYAKAAYVARAGVIDIPASRFLRPVPVAEMRNRLMVQFVDPAAVPQVPQVALREADYTAETDDRAIYLDEPLADESSRERSLTIQVRHRGAAPPAGTRLRIAQYAPSPPGFIEFGWQLVSASDPEAQTPFVRYVTDDAAADGGVTDGAYVIVPVTPEPGGLPFATATIGLSSLRPGPPVLQFEAIPPRGTGSSPKKEVTFWDTAQSFFANVRGLPFHNALALEFENWLRTGPSVDLATQRVFDVVFRTFFLMYPAMRFMRDPLQFQAWRGPVCELTDPAIFERPTYMPVTRSLSAGQRRILELWSTYLDGTLHAPIVRERVGRRG